MNNPFGLPDEVFDSILTSAARQGMEAAQKARGVYPKTTKPPLTEEQSLEKGATAAKKLYDSYIKVGFTEFQAFDLLKCVLTNKR